MILKRKLIKIIKKINFIEKRGFCYGNIFNEKPIEINSYNDYDKYLKNLILPNKVISLFMDYDGTLAKINPDPRKTNMTMEMKNLFKNLCKHPKIFPAVISGRSIDDVKEKIEIDNITYAGKHGFEILYSDKEKFEYPISNEIKKNLPKIFDELKKFEKNDKIWIEDKKISITFHYHSLPDYEQMELFKIASEIIKKYGYQAIGAHGAIDAKPPVDWHKGKAAVKILEKQFGNDWNEKTNIIFAGDDNTDEDLMKTLKNKSISFRISQNFNIKTNGMFLVKTPDEIYLLLKWIENFINYSVVKK